MLPVGWTLGLFHHFQEAETPVTATIRDDESCWSYFREHKYICIFRHFLAMRWRRQFNSFLMEDNDPFNLHGQYHGCWWPGGAMSQGISSCDDDLVHPEYSRCSHNKVELLKHLTLVCKHTDAWVDSLCPDETIWCHRSLSTLVQVKTCFCHYLNQYQTDLNEI